MDTAGSIAQGPAPVILLVEDEEDLRELMSSALERHGYSVITAEEGSDALRKLDDRGSPSPCLIISDLLMPGMNGWEFCERARQRPELNAVPIVVHSSISQPFPAGATRALRKPLSLNKLLSVVDEFCKN